MLQHLSETYFCKIHGERGCALAGRVTVKLAIDNANDLAGFALLYLIVNKVRRLKIKKRTSAYATVYQIHGRNMARGVSSILFRLIEERVFSFFLYKYRCK